MPTGYRAITRIARNHESRPDWMAFGKCRKGDPDLHFPPPGRRGRNQATEAIAVCMACPVRAACLEFALLGPEPDGIWAATNAEERRRILADRAVPVPQGIAS